jgi:hypothetical protein
MCKKPKNNAVQLEMLQDHKFNAKFHLNAYYQYTSRNPSLND